MIKVSVIVPVYNVEKYLKKCLDSLVNQTLEEIEIVVVNDGSTDESQKIISRFQMEFPLKIKSFLKENGGLSDARNYGLNNCSGAYIGFVDSDDWVSKSMFEEMYTLAEKNNAEMAICNLQKVDEQGNVSQKLTQIPNMPEVIDLKNNFSVFSDLSYFACNKLFKKELFLDLRFQKGMHFEDIELIPKLLLRCKTIVQTQNYYYQYLERADSISKTHTEKGLDILKAVENVEKSFKNSDYKIYLKELKGFQILEGVYTFLAYLAFVKDERVYRRMSSELKDFRRERQISTMDILQYKRFGKNNLLSLSVKKQLYYIFYFSNISQFIRRFV
jgi:glycosyltransferase involved in cell wall biosynthesis